MFLYLCRENADLIWKLAGQIVYLALYLYACVWIGDVLLIENTSAFSTQAILYGGLYTKGYFWVSIR